ncbi:MAG: glycoside hydrolase family 32 protein, partial [Pyrinomonadaceae bacterium]|nr:glycoside hydrolase family 32 protein [Phycisphaerales bacterium]
PVALTEENGVMIFSGTAVFDQANTSALGTPDQPPLIAAYTGHEEKARRQHQNIASSIDLGRTWTKFAGNPVLDLQVAEFRDPKVFWHEPTRRWIMVVALAADRKALFYSSPDLKAWTKLSEFGPQGRTGVPNWECPDLFELAVENDPAETRWVLVINVGGNGPQGGSGCQYFIGRFDGATFTNDNPAQQVLWLDQGPDFYAFQSYQDAPDHRRIGLAWMTSTHYAGGQPTSPWRGSMTIPRELTLRRTPHGLRLAQTPIAGLANFLKSRGATPTMLNDQPLPPGVTPLQAAASVAIITAEFEPGDAERFGLRVRQGDTEFTDIGYDVKQHELYIDRRRAGASGFNPGFAARHAAATPLDADGHVRLTIVVDQQSVEAFGNNGLTAITSLVFPGGDSSRMSLFAEAGTAKLVKLDILPMPRK